MLCRIPEGLYAAVLAGQPSAVTMSIGRGQHPKHNLLRDPMATGVYPLVADTKGILMMSDLRVSAHAIIRRTLPDHQHHFCLGVGLHTRLHIHQCSQAAGPRVCGPARGWQPQAAADRQDMVRARTLPGLPTVPRREPPKPALSICVRPSVLIGNTHLCRIPFRSLPYFFG